MADTSIQLRGFRPEDRGSAERVSGAAVPGRASASAAGRGVAPGHPRHRLISGPSVADSDVWLNSCRPSQVSRWSRPQSRRDRHRSQPLRATSRRETVGRPRTPRRHARRTACSGSRRPRVRPAWPLPEVEAYARAIGAPRPTAPGWPSPWDRGLRTRRRLPPGKPRDRLRRTTGYHSSGCPLSRPGNRRRKRSRPGKWCGKARSGKRSGTCCPGRRCTRRSRTLRRTVHSTRRT